MTLPYDKTNVNSIESYAKRLLNHSLREVITDSGYQVTTQRDINNRGDLGMLIEKEYFFYEPNSNPEPDFPEANLELKVTPIKRGSDGKYRAKERLVLNIINFFEESRSTWETSSFWKKNKLLLLMFYLYRSDVSVLDYIFRFIGKYEFPPEDLLIIRKDWEEIVNKIKQGKAHEISERDTLYLAACRKGVGHNLDLRSQPFSEIRAPQRAYSLKQGYMNIILDRWTKKEDLEYQPILKSVNELEAGKSFEEIVIEKIKPYYGMSVDQIIQKLDGNVNKDAKGILPTLTLRMLGIKTKKAEEFIKAGIIIKTFRVKNDNTPKESISFPYFKYKEIINEHWEDSTLRSSLDKRFLFVIYKFSTPNCLVLEKAMFWSMPYDDLEDEVRKTWELTVRRIREGKADRLPKMSETKVCHVRPHGINSQDTDETPEGRFLVKKCFWLNAHYIKRQISDEFIY
jgi:DNA mismatch repair protein MutH